MARRKVLAVGRASVGWLEEALGYWSRQSMPDVLSTTPKPVFDLSAVEMLTGIPIEAEAASEIQQAYESYAVVIFSSAIAQAQANGADVGVQPIETMDKSEFRSLISKIQKKSGELEKLINSLAELDAGLLCRPNDNRDRTHFSTRLSASIEERFQCNHPSYTVDDQGFSDYYSFRKLLDYFANFEGINRPFNNSYGLRYSYEPDYSDYERIIRRIVVSLYHSGYPTTVTIPTDTNPEYESPIITALLEFQRQHNVAFKMANGHDLDFSQNFSYRQFAYLVTLILKDIAAWAEALTLFRSRNL